MKKLFALFGLGLIVLSGNAAYANVSFDATQAFQVFSDSRWDGSNRHFGFLFDIGDDLQVGYFFEEGLWNWRADVGQAAPNFVNVNATNNGLRGLKRLNKYLSAGIDIGTSQIAIRTAGGTTATVAAAAPLAQTKPFVDVLGRASYSVTKGGVTSGVYFDVGYRFLEINDVAAGGILGAATERTLSDLNALLLGIGVRIGF